MLRDILSKRPEGPLIGHERRKPSIKALETKFIEQVGDQKLGDVLENPFTTKAPNIKILEYGLEKGFLDDYIATLTSSYHQKKSPLLPGLGINTTINNKEFPTNFHTDTATTTNQIAVPNTNESHLFLSNSSDAGNPEVQADAYEKTTELHILNVPYPQTLASDSGYASLGNGQNTQNEKEDDAQTVFTDNKELDVPGDVKEKLSTAFTGELLQNIREVLSACYIEKEIRNGLAEILKEFSIRCRRTASSKQQNDATTFVRHYRQYVPLKVVPYEPNSSRHREE